jgi:hypothetical protein
MVIQRGSAKAGKVSEMERVDPNSPGGGLLIDQQLGE